MGRKNKREIRIVSKNNGNGHAPVYGSLENTFTNPPTHRDDPMLNMSEVAAMLGKHPSTISRWINDGLLIFTRSPKGLPQIRKSVVNRFLGGSCLEVKVS